MPIPRFQPRQGQQNWQLLERILERVQTELPGALGSAITFHGGRSEPGLTVLAARGCGGEIVEAQFGGLGGPVVDAYEHQVPVLSLDLWTDDRWPDLTLEAMRSRAPERDEVWREVRGVAAMPGPWQDEGTVVLSCVLAEPAAAATVNTLVGYEQLVNAAMITTAAQEDTAVADMLAILQSRGAIEQAKGAIMGCLRCDADTAWTTLRRASHESNVKLRGLAVALVEHVSGSPAEAPAIGSPIVPDERARRAARLLWTVLTHASKSASPGD